MANQDIAEKKPSIGSESFSGVRTYFRETFGELRKVHWPTWPEARTLTAVVLAVMAAMAIFLGLFDLAFGWVMNRVILLDLIGISILVTIALAIIVLVVFAGKDRR
jgi:preprotein translocase subunit SecE